jgi:hypothetical protein
MQRKSLRARVGGLMDLITQPSVRGMPDGILASSSYAFPSPLNAHTPSLPAYPPSFIQ